MFLEDFQKEELSQFNLGLVFHLKETGVDH